VFQLDLDSFCDLINEWIHGMLLINYLKRSKTYLRFYICENFILILMIISYTEVEQNSTLRSVCMEVLIEY
jgi:hypothetical protein